MLQRDMLDQLFPPIFSTLRHPDDEVVVAALSVLAQIMKGRSSEEDTTQEESDRPDYFPVVVDKLLRLFQESEDMMDKRSRLMILQLCGHLDPRRLYVTVARGIREADAKFAQHLVQTFSWILFTAAETKRLRDELLTTTPIAALEGDGRARPEGPAARELPGANGTGDPADGTSLFLELLEPWFHNPVSALALCLWAGQYELATELTARIAAFEPTLDLLRQLDQLVHLLESPIFSRLRLRLLEPRRHPALLKCLMGLAMVLPQAGAFRILRERIHVVQSGLLLEAQRDSRPKALEEGGVGASDAGHMLWWSGAKPSSVELGRSSEPSSTVTDIASLLERFDAMAASAQLAHN